MQYSHSFFFSSLHLALSACLHFIMVHPLVYNALIYNNNNNNPWTNPKIECWVVVFRNVPKRTMAVKSNPAILHNSFSPHADPTHSSFLSDQRPAPEPWVGGMCSCWRASSSSHRPAVSVLWPAAHPQWVRVWGHAVLIRALGSTWCDLEAHSDVKTHPRLPGLTGFTRSVSNMLISRNIHTGIHVWTCSYIVKAF